MHKGLIIGQVPLAAGRRPLGRAAPTHRASPKPDIPTLGGGRLPAPPRSSLPPSFRLFNDQAELHPNFPANSNPARGGEMAEQAPDLEQNLDEELLLRTCHALICVDSASACDDG